MHVRLFAELVLFLYQVQVLQELDLFKTRPDHHQLFITSRAAARSYRGSGEDDFCFLAMVSSFSLLLQLVLIKLTYILIYWGRFVTF